MHDRWQRLVLCSCMWLGLFFAAPAGASALRLVSLSELARRSDLIIEGRAHAWRSFFEGGRIVTSMQLEVDEVWHGQHEPGAILEVFVLGGRVGDLAQRVNGMPSLALGERVVLMLGAASRGGYHPVELWQGVFYVMGEGEDALVRRDTAGARVAGDPALARAMPARLSALREAVKNALAK